MVRRSDIDWERIQRLYVAGQLTIRQIADECGVTHQAITKKAKREGWQRDLSAAIKERAKAKIAQIDVAQLVEESAQQSAQQSAQTLKQIVESASDVAAGVVIRHRADIRLQHERATRLEALFDDLIDKAPTQVSDDGEGISAGDVLKMSQTLKNIVEARAKLMDKEREAFNINDAPPANDTPAVVVEFVDAVDD